MALTKTPIELSSTPGIVDNSNATAITIDSSEKVGIGTSSPSRQLTVQNSGNAIAAITSGTSSSSFLLMGDTDSDNIGMLKYNNADNSLGFYAGSNSSERMRIDSSGNVTIGSAALSATVGLKFQADTGTFTLAHDRGSHALVLSDSDGTGEVLRVDTSGNLLVGTTTTSASVTGGRIFSTGRLVTSVNDAGHYIRRNNSDGSLIEFARDSTPVGSIGVVSGDNPYFTSASRGIRITGNNIRPCSTGGANLDNTISLGDTGQRFKDLYLSGGVYLGGTGAANKLDDYEEGTWGSVNGTTGSNCSSLTHTNQYYTKVGRLVTLSFDVAGTITSTGVETSIKFNLPFTAINSVSQGAGGTANFLTGSGADRFGLGLVYNGTSADATSHIYIPSDQINASGAFTGMRVSMSYLTT